MKIKTIFMLATAMFVLAACSKENSGRENGGGDTAGVAYLSIKLEQTQGSRASEEHVGTNETELKSLYIITFDNLENVVPFPDGGNYYHSFTSAQIEPEAVKVSGKGTQLLVIANPGPKLIQAITGLGSLSTYTSFNQAISDATLTEITSSSSGFAMINSGDDTGLTENQKITIPLIDISGNIEMIDDHHGSEADAKTAAESNRAKISIERLTAKIELKTKQNIDTPTGASFNFTSWTLDAVNSTYYPFAEKTILGTSHTGSDYEHNFYTEDPNFTGKIGLKYTTYDSENSPVPVAPYDWKPADEIAYCIENTVEANSQTYENVTRLVIKGKYYPESSWTGDWFNFAGINYESLDVLKAAYALGGTNLVVACDKMFDEIESYAASADPVINLTGTDFASLTIGDLNQIPNGGQLVKTTDGTPCIRWYQDGLSYYFYEIRHDDEKTEMMDFGKYGVVRNNWYSLTLTKVTGPGTPWYPDINEPGPGDPDPTDPIDEAMGYLGIEIDVKKWIIWGKDIEI